MPKLKGFKVSDLNNSKFGVAASSLADLLEKSSRKLNVSAFDARLVLPDGSRLEDEQFFQTLPNQSDVFLLLPGQNIDTSPGVLRLVSSLLKTWRGENLLDGVRSLVRELGVDLSVDAGDDDRSALSSRADDPDWFQDLDTRARCKEQYLRERCAVRVRTFYYRSRRQTWQQLSPPQLCPSRRASGAQTVRQILDAVWRHMADELRRNEAHGGYFDRGDKWRMCDEAGVFVCAGVVDCTTGCGFPTRHRINPYSSRHSRIQFSTWNLDHRIERSRSVLPALLSACHLCHERHLPETSVNWRYFYSLLFTAVNLSLVHIVCHDKRAHSGCKCEPELYLISESHQTPAQPEKQPTSKQKALSEIEEPPKRLKRRPIRNLQTTEKQTATTNRSRSGR